MSDAEIQYLLGFAKGVGERLGALERRVQRMDELLSQVMLRMGELNLRLQQLEDDG